jgi:hypothetical protein
VHGSDDWFRVRQATVAENLHKHINTVATALRRGRELGWLELRQERKRGRGHFQADAYRMTAPEIPTRGSGSFGEEIPTRGSGSFEEYPHGGVEIPTPGVFKNGVLPAETPTLQGLYPGFSTTGFKNPGCDERGSQARATALVEEWIPGDLRHGGAKRVLVGAVMDGLDFLGEEGTAQVVANWLELRQPTSWVLRGLIDKALNGDAP